jgi:arsenate reductase-like glutaredoxin family protein
MSALKKILMAVLFVLLVVLLIGFVRTYQHIKIAKDYVDFVTDSVNGSLAEIENINIMLNELEYDEEGNEISELQDSLSTLKENRDSIVEENDESSKPRGSEDVQGEFGSYLTDLDELISSLETVVTSLEELDEKGVFEENLTEYITKSNELQLQSEVLETELNEFVQGYTKFDFKNFLDAIRFI